MSDSIIQVEWCTFCLHNPSDGIVTVEDEHGYIVDLPSCEDCYNKLLRNEIDF